MAEIIFINPRFDIPTGAWSTACQSWGKRPTCRAPLPTLAGLTPAGHTVILFDENIEAIDFDRSAR